MNVEIVIISILIFIVLFFLLREVFTWYWKINKIVEIQQSQLIILLKLLERSGQKIDWSGFKKVSGMEGTIDSRFIE